MKFTKHLKAIEKFVLDHSPPPEIRRHIHVLEEHLDADDSLLEQIAQKEVEMSSFKQKHSELEAKHAALVEKNKTSQLASLQKESAARRKIGKLDHNA